MAWIAALASAAQAKQGQANQAQANAQQVAAQQQAGQAMLNYRQLNHDTRLAGLKAQVGAYAPVNNFLGGKFNTSSVADPFAGTNWSSASVPGGQGGDGGVESPFSSLGNFTPGQTTHWALDKAGITLPGGDTAYNVVDPGSWLWKKIF